MKWAIQNPLKSWTLFELELNEVQLIINTLSPNEIKLLKIANNQDLQWQRFDPKSHSILISNYGKDNVTFLKTTNSDQDPEDLDEADFFMVHTKKSILPRLYDRIEMQFEVKILGSNQSIITTTLDLSEGGIQVKDKLPNWLSGYFVVEIKDHDQSYSLMCNIVEDQIEKRRIQIMSEESDPHFVKYKNWLIKLRQLSDST